MRELKFRVWDKKTKKMRQLANIVFNAGFGVEPNDNTIKLIWVKGKDIIEDKDIQIQREDNFELMQFTGLHDKNGKEIYEGDILQQVHYVFSNDEYDHKGFKKLIIQVLWGQKEAAFIFKVIKKIDIEMPKDYKEPYREVIGNIYENPDLLKGADNIE